MNWILLPQKQRKTKRFIFFLMIFLIDFYFVYFSLQIIDLLKTRPAGDPSQAENLAKLKAEKLNLERQVFRLERGTHIHISCQIELFRF